ncbi:cytochrome c oxidase subunit 3 [Oceanobacillus manasiensis]|uniref:cytochrome c oxidase subunit 3 n=1 Tax=Oceanobacillus manasiensis TaxID=586413 RepID=UPI0006944EBD|nr:cytochrome c oxidase subunit 3 [Oceanobacillus manasiensis]
MNREEMALFKDKKMGFFIYLGVEVVMFAVLFATYLIFTPATQGPHPSEVFEAKIVILSSFFLLSSSGTLWLGERALKKKKQAFFLIGLGITKLFAIIFLGFEVYEFASFVKEGYGMSASVFMSSYYALVGLHAAHVAFGVGWMGVLFVQYFRRIPLTLFTEKLSIFAYYWHFVDIVWVFIIGIVYLPYLL